MASGTACKYGIGGLLGGSDGSVSEHSEHPSNQTSAVQKMDERVVVAVEDVTSSMRTPPSPRPIDAVEIAGRERMAGARPIDLPQAFSRARNAPPGHRSCQSLKLGSWVGCNMIASIPLPFAPSPFATQFTSCSSSFLNP